MTLVRTLKNQINRFRHAARRKVSYAQCGEDLIIDYAARTLGIEGGRYLDIGAHHPTYLSNTFHFYRQGWRGVCIEPDASLLPPFHKLRSRDTLLNVGIGARAGEQDFYVMSTPTLNTFSRSEAERYVSYGKERIERILRVPIMAVRQLIGEYFPSPPQIVSLDVEGLDFEILQAFDFEHVRPQIFCVETLTYAEDGSERKLGEIVAYMEGRDYFSYADTYVNTIFIDKAAWRRRAVVGG